MKRHLALIVLFIFIATPVFAKVDVVEGAPAGFEKMDAPRAALLNVFYGGEPLGQFWASITPASIHFDDATAIINTIPNIDKKELVIEALSKNIPSNADQICYKGPSTECGKIEPEIAGVIFDERSLSAELFINKTYLGLTDKTGPRYLPLPERNISSVYAFNGAVAGNTDDSPNFSLSNQSVFSYGELHLDTLSNLSNEGVRFDIAALSVDRNGWQGTAGLFRSRSMQLASDRDIAGFSFSTSLRTRLDQHKTEGNDIIVFLPRRAIVSIYREGRIYSSRSYDSGNQSIDTSELPEGAYNITLKIQESDGTMREENRFFAKSPDIPPPDDPTYYVQGGVMRKPANDDASIPELTRDILLRAGTVQRVTENIGVEVSALGLEDRAALEAGSFLIYSGMKLRAGGLISTAGDLGLQASYQYTFDGWNISADARKIWDDDEPLNIKDFNAVISPTMQATALISYTIRPDITLGFRSNYSEQRDITNSSYGPTLEWYLWREGESMLTLTTDIAKTNDETNASAFLRFSRKLGNYGVSGSGGYVSENDSGLQTDLRGWYDGTTPERTLTAAVGLQKDERSQSINMDGDYSNSIGRVKGLIQQSWGDNDATTSYAGNFSFNMAESGGSVHFGGNHNDISAIIINTEGDATAEMKIMINGVEREKVEVGGKKAIYLSPYQTYNVRLIPTESAMLEYDLATRKVTLYPGNVVNLKWDINNFYVVLAKIITPDGTALSEAFLRDTPDTATDKSGWVQVQMPKTNELIFDKSEQQCSVKLEGGREVNGVIIYDKPLTCEKLASS